MAHSSTHLPTPGSFNHIGSPLPPSVADGSSPANSDRRNSELAESIEHMTSDFTQNGNDHYQKQMLSYYMDARYIENAQPYENALLKDFSIDILAEMNTIADNEGGLTGSMEVLPRAGIFASQYAQLINDAMEDRDVRLTWVAERHKGQIDGFKTELDYTLRVAQEERKIFFEMIRDRVYRQVIAKKRAILLGEDDRNALLVDGQSGAGMRGNKRKRGATTVIDDNGTSQASSSPNSHQPSTTPNSIEDLFTEEEMTSVIKQASHAAIEFMAAKRRDCMDQGSQDPGKDVPDATKAEDENEGTTLGKKPEICHLPLSKLTDDDLTAEAYHATRSTRRAKLNFVPVISSNFPKELPSDLTGRAAIIPQLGTFTMERMLNLQECSLTTPLSEEEKDADLAIMAAAVKAKESRGHVYSQKAEDGHRPGTDYSGDQGAVAVEYLRSDQAGSVSNMRTEMTPAVCSHHSTPSPSQE